MKIHILVDDLSVPLGNLCSWPTPSAFYAVFDGHGGPEAAEYLKNNIMRFLFEDADWTPTSEVDDAFLKKLEESHRKAFLRADLALADRASSDDCSVPTDCGTTALTALVLGRHLLVANAGDCHAVLCRNGDAVQISQDHKPTYLPERRRVEELGGIIEFLRLNGLAVTRALGDWNMKRGSAPSLIAEPDVYQVLLTKHDEFLIMACDGIWDVMENQEVVDFVRSELRQHHDPQKCAVQLVDHAILVNKANDNLTFLVVCFSSLGSWVRRW